MHPGLAIAALAAACPAFALACGGEASTPTADTADDARPVGCVALADGRCVLETFANPPVLEPDADGVYTLTLGPTEVMLGDQRHCVRSYNGLYPGPTIETPARDGEAPRQVRVDVVNAFAEHDYRSLDGRLCTCKTADQQSCVPEHVHDSCNRDTSDDCSCTDADGAVCEHMYDFNTTNLHAHGSHVRPDYVRGGGCAPKPGPSGLVLCRECGEDTCDGDAADDTCFFGDDVLSTVHPGFGAQHRWDIDEDGTHHEGVNWYHPHIHGTTAIQVASGAAGAWIVRGPLDAQPGIRDAHERIMVFSTPPIGKNGSPPLADGQACDEDHITINDFPTLGDTNALQQNFINGRRRSRIVLGPGQIERWRFVHASFLDEVFIGLFRGKDADCAAWDVTQPIPLTQIARDGITLPRPPGDTDWPYAPPYFFMAPGYRVEAIFDGNALADGETACLVAARFLQDVDSDLTDGAVGILATPTAQQILDHMVAGDLLVTVNATAALTPTTTTPPDYAAVAALAPPLKFEGGAVDALTRCAEAQAVTDPGDVDQVATFQVGLALAEGADSCGCNNHNINCRNLEITDRDRYPWDRVLELGRVDHWRLFSLFDGHPFHIHINPFVVCPLPPAGSPDRNAKGRLFEPPFAHWRDTYLLNLDRTADLLTEYRSYTGAYVFHCHKLTHEDHGMMEVVRICDPSQEDCSAACSGGPCAWDSCVPGDADCERRLLATLCVIDPSYCPEALPRCLHCGDGPPGCGPGYTCGDPAPEDGVRRCVPSGT